MSQKILVLNADEVRRCLTMPQAIEAMRLAFGEHARQRDLVPLRTMMDLAEDANVTLVMPSYWRTPEREDAAGEVGVKILSLCRQNPPRGLPYIQAVVMLMDAQSGGMIAMIEGSALTALRTGAASGLATEFLASESSRSAAIFGAGVQGRTQLEAILVARPSIETIWVFDQKDGAALRFAKEMSDLLHRDIRPAPSLDCLREVDVICTATPSGEVLFQADQLKAGVHVNAIGSYRLDMHEIPETFVARSKVVVDDLEACLEETADLILPIEKGLIPRDGIHAELGDLVLDRKMGRTSAEETTLFKSVGLAIQDLAAASRAYQIARENNVGTWIDL
jgi:ornithine cyclodeaminase/alanine dehydrogenase-like protein (mu-crystallin family)